MVKQILVVEDDPIALKNVTGFLKEEGYGVEQAADGTAALALLRQKRFDLLLSDIAIPRPNGYQLMDYTRDTFPRTAIILMTANSTSDRTATPGRDADACLLKPLDLEELARTVGGVLKQKKTVLANRLPARFAAASEESAQKATGPHRQPSARPTGRRS